jgi:hypothetical protein
MTPSEPTTADRARIRSYRPIDRAAVIELERFGVLPGGGPADRSPADLDDMEATYFSQPESHFWVAQDNNRLVGMIGLIEREPHVAVIRQLRVARGWEDTGLCRRLVKTALRHSWLSGAVKVIIDAPCDANRAIQFLGQLGFQYTRARARDGRELVEFYPTLYARPHDAATSG